MNRSLPLARLSIFALVLTAAVAQDPAARTVQIHSQDIVPIHAKLKYTTLIEVPASEKIMEAATGDKEFWVVNGTQNFAFIKPAKASTQTNLNLITASGNVYSFLVKEAGEGPTDLKLFIEPKSDGMLSALNGQPPITRVVATQDDLLRLHS